MSYTYQLENMDIQYIKKSSSFLLRFSMCTSDLNGRKYLSKLVIGSKNMFALITKSIIRNFTTYVSARTFKCPVSTNK